MAEVTQPEGGIRRRPEGDNHRCQRHVHFLREKGHGERALPRVRAKECSAWDHPCKKCDRKNHWESLCRTRKETQDEPETASADMEAATFDTFCGITSGAQEVTPRIDVDDITALSHHIYNEQKGTWLKGPSEPHPYITLKVCVYPEDYEHLGCQTPPETMQSHAIEAMADTGCQSCLASETLIQKLGIKREHLIKVRLQMKTANKQQVEILRAILVRFRGTDHGGATRETRQMVYITTETDRVFFSEQACKELGIVSKTFPEVNIDQLAQEATCALETLQCISWEDILQATSSDKEMCILQQYIENGLPEARDEVPADIREFLQHREHLYTVDGVVMYKDRVLVPNKLRANILSTLHAAHQGVTMMTARAKTSVFWPGISRDIENTRKNCPECDRMAPSQSAAPPTPLEYPEYPFQKVCADFFVYRGKHFLVIVDRYSNWPIVERSHDGANGLIATLRKCSLHMAPRRSYRVAGVHCIIYTDLPPPDEQHHRRRGSEHRRVPEGTLAVPQHARPGNRHITSNVRIRQGH